VYSNSHLQQINEKLVFVVEDFYEDFKKACKRLLEAMDKGMVTEKKMNERYYYTF